MYMCIYYACHSPLPSPQGLPPDSSSLGTLRSTASDAGNVGWHYLSHAICLMRPHLFCVFCRVKNHHDLLHDLPLLKKTSVRQVAPPENSTVSERRRLSTRTWKTRQTNQRVVEKRVLSSGTPSVPV